ncbi:glycosyl hydrolase family 61-domain-containing protein [Aspergillus oleicola]
MSVARTSALALASAALVAGHGYVQGIVADGTYYGGYLVNNYPYNPSPPDTVGWSEDATDLGFVAPSAYTDADIICHKDAENAKISATVSAGGDVELQWTEWPESHKGPVIDYLASCNGDCTTVDKTTLEWVKISESGLIDGSSSPGTWASDNLISNNNSWTVTIPSSIASGNYVLRHEIIALHSAGSEDGAQNYPQCVNLEVTGGGSDSPSGTLGTALYTPTDDGILFNIYTTLDSYPIPGPTLYSGASSGSGSGSGSSGSATSSVPVIPTSSSGASSTPLIPSSSAPVYAPTSTAAQVSVTTTAPAETQVVQPTETATSTVTETEAAPTVTSTETEVAAAPTETAVETEVEAPAPTSSATPSTGSGSGSGSSTGSGSGSASSSYPTDSSSLTAWFDSLSAEEFLSYLKATFSWLVADNKVHARALN